MTKTLDTAMIFTQLAFVKLLLLVTLFSPEVLCAPKDCARLKQDTFNLWLSVKETCDDGLKDCCQVLLNIYCMTILPSSFSQNKQTTKQNKQTYGQNSHVRFPFRFS